MALAERLTEYVRACFTGIWIESHEHDDALAEIAKLCRQENWRLAAWDVDQGLRIVSESAATGVESGSGDPLAAIRAFGALGSPDSSALLVLANFHRFLNSAEIVQALARQISQGKQSRTFVVVLSPVVQIPVELEKLFVIVEHELPDRDQLEQIAHGLATEPGELPDQQGLAAVLDSAAGLTRYEAEGAFSLSLVQHRHIEPAAIWDLKSQMLKKSGLLTLHRGSERFAAVLLTLQKPDLDPQNHQGILIEVLPRILGSKAKGALPTLLAFVADEKITPYLRGKAMAAATQIAPTNPLVFAALVRSASAHDDATKALQFDAIEQLGKVGPPAASALPMLHEILAGKNEGLRDCAYEAIGRIALVTPPNTELADALVDKSADVRAAAHQQLRLHVEAVQSQRHNEPLPRTFADERCLMAMREILENHADDFDRRATLQTLTITGPGGNPRMIKVLLSLVGVSPYTARQVLARLEPNDPAAVVVLLESLRRTSNQPRSLASMAAVQGLQRYGVNARVAVPDLIAGFDRLVAVPDHGFSVDDVRDYLAAMVAADRTNVAVISRLLDLMAPEHPLNHPIKPYQPVAPVAMDVLAMIGLPADPKLHAIAVPFVVNAFADPRSASGATKLLENTDVDVLTPDAALFVPLLVKIVELPRPHDGVKDDYSIMLRQSQLCLSAMRVLARLGPMAKQALPSLKALAAREDQPPNYDFHVMQENSITHEARKTIAAISRP